MVRTGRKRRFSIRAFLKLTRLPNLLIIVLTQYLVAICLVGAHDTWQSTVSDFNLLLLVGATISIAAAGYIINDYYDIKIDYINKPSRVVVGKLVKRRIVLVSHIVLNALGILAGFYLSIYIGIINFFSAFVLWWYSNHLKRQPFVGNLSIAILTASSLMVIPIYYGQGMFLVANYAVFGFSITLIREIIKDMEDIRGDARFGSKTLPIIWGFRKTKTLLFALTFVFVVLLFILSYNFGDATLIGFFLLLILPIGHLLYLLYMADTQKRFARLSLYCKLLMLAGVLSMLFLNI